MNTAAASSADGTPRAWPQVPYVKLGPWGAEPELTEVEREIQRSVHAFAEKVMRPIGYQGRMGYASAGSAADFIVVNMVAEAASGQRTPQVTFTTIQGEVIIPKDLDGKVTLVIDNQPDISGLRVGAGVPARVDHEELDPERRRPRHLAAHRGLVDARAVLQHVTAANFPQQIVVRYVRNRQVCD